MRSCHDRTCRVSPTQGNQGEPSPNNVFFFLTFHERTGGHQPLPKRLVESHPARETPWQAHLFGQPEVGSTSTNTCPVVPVESNFSRQRTAKATAFVDSAWEEEGNKVHIHGENKMQGNATFQLTWEERHAFKIRLIATEILQRRRLFTRPR